MTRGERSKANATLVIIFILWRRFARYPMLNKVAHSIFQKRMCTSSYRIPQYSADIVALITERIPHKSFLLIKSPRALDSVIHKQSICMLVYASDWRLPLALKAVRRKLGAGIRGECLQSAYKIALSYKYHGIKTAGALKTYLTGRYGRLSLRARSIFS